MSKVVSQYRINTWHFIRLICYWYFLFLRKKNTCRQFNGCRKSLRVIWNRWDGWRRRQNAWTHDHKPIQAVNYMSQLLWLSLLHELNRKKNRPNYTQQLSLSTLTYQFVSTLDMDGHMLPKLKQKNSLLLIIPSDFLCKMVCLCYKFPLNLRMNSK